MVFRVVDAGATRTQVWTASVPGASIPLAVPLLGNVWVGGSDGKLHQLAIGTGVDTAHAIQTTSSQLISAPIIDGTTCSSTCTAYVVTESGRLYGKAIPY